MNDAGLERALDDLPDGGGPREGWQDCVLARIDVPPAPRRPRWPFLVAGSGVIAAAAAVILLVALRSPPTATPPVRPAEGRATIERVERAVSEAERAGAQELLRAKIRDREELGRRLEQLKARARKTKKGETEKIVAKCEPADPLCGIE